MRTVPAWIARHLPEPVLYRMRQLAKPLKRQSAAYRAAYAEAYAEATRAATMAPEELRRHQVARLRELLVYAYETVPYYRETFRAAGVVPADVDALEHLAAFPTIDRSTLVDHLEDLCSRALPPEDRAYLTTGGSTGSPVALYEERDRTFARERAFYDVIFGRVGCHRGSRLVSLRGWLPVRPDRPYMMTPGILFLSSRHLVPEWIPCFLGLIRKFRPDAVWCYPSTGVTLARYMLAHKEPPFEGLKAVLPTSEGLLPGQRELMEEAYGARVFRSYGHTERCVIGGECEVSSAYHFEPLYGIAEFTPVAARGESPLYEMVGTGFINRAMPLIRYRTGDLASDLGLGCECGRAYVTAGSIHGRLQELAVDRTGALVSMAVVNMHDSVFDPIERFQFHQSRPGEIILRIVPRPGGIDQTDLARVRTAVQERLGESMDLDVRVVEEIPPTESGKHRWLVQELDTEAELRRLTET